jgi:glycosyltransferase involved in cell wall biosynthesis
VPGRARFCVATHVRLPLSLNSMSAAPQLASAALIKADTAISIVMPVRNAAPTLPLALACIGAQTFSNWELLAIDDGSQDQSAAILQAAAIADPRVRVVRQGALGIAEALQHGCTAARGEFIARMDADDWIVPERLARQWDFLQQHPEIGVVACRVRHRGDPMAQAGYAAHVAWINSLLTARDIEQRRFVESPIAHPSVMFRRQLLLQHGGYRSGDFPEDYELWLRWMEAGVRFGKVDAELLLWNDAPSRLSRTDPRYCTEAFYRTKNEYLMRWIKRYVQPSRQIWLWGAGRITRRRFLTLETAGIPISGFIDVDVKKLGRLRDGRRVVGPNELPTIDQAFILAAVSTRGARDLIAASLKSVGRAEGTDYLLVA